MRIYEFAKGVGVSAKQVLQVLQDNGMDVKSHMAQLSDQEQAFLDTFFKSTKKDEALVQQTQSDVGDIDKKHNRPQTKDTGVKQNIPSGASSKSNQVSVKEPLPNVSDIPATRSIVLRQMTVSEVAQIAGVQVGEVILLLLRWGVMAPKNQALPETLVARIAQHYQLQVTQPPLPVAEEIGPREKIVSLGKNLQERLPVVVVLGHVDHGKTTLLDFIRNTRVAAREKGGITQHLGAYEAKTTRGNIVFLDTPGHEAFSKIRQRGIRVADIVVLIVAADDGVMPQTIESIKRAKAMHVPIIVAINKVDKVDQRRIDVVKRELSQHDLLVEDWGGEVICVPLSAKTGLGVDALLEMIVLQAQLMELRADVSGHAKGYVLESRLEKGRGSVATLILQHGSLKVGDYIISGSTGGRISSIVDSRGERCTVALPSLPVQVAGFESLPEAGDYFESVDRNNYRSLLQRAQESRVSTTAEKSHTEGALNIIIKTDTDSSRDALIESITKLSKKAVSGFNLIHAGIGNVNESDVELAYNTGASIVGLHIKGETNAVALAQRKHVIISLFDIIYKLLESLEAQDAGTKQVELVRTKIGQAEVIRVFDIKNIGIIAGALVKDGRITRDGILVVYRNNKKIGEGKLRSLQREKRSVKEVHQGYECGFMLEKYDDWMVEDRVECFVEEPKK